MRRVIKIKLSQNVANYGIAEEITMKNTLPLPAVSTVLGSIHKAAGWKDYHKIRVGIKGEYGSISKKMYMTTTFLDYVCPDRGMFVKMVSSNVLSNAYEIVAKPLYGDDNSRRNFRIKKGYKILREDLLDEYLQLKNNIQETSDKIKKLNKEKSDKVKETEDNDLKRTIKQDYSKKIKETKEYKKKLEIELQKYKSVEKIPQYINLLTDVRLTLYLVPERQEDYDVIMNHVDDLKTIGRSEDFVDIQSAKILSCSNATTGRIDEHTYIPRRVSDDFTCNGNKLCGTIMSIREQWHIDKNNKRIFNKIPCLWASNVELKNKNDKTFVDENNEMFVLIN